jgi:hypothetical protein
MYSMSEQAVLLFVFVFQFKTDMLNLLKRPLNFQSQTDYSKSTCTQCLINLFDFLFLIFDFRQTC